MLNRFGFLEILYRFSNESQKILASNAEVFFLKILDSISSPFGKSYMVF